LGRGLAGGRIALLFHVMRSSLENLWQIVRSIPAGQVASYGEVGRALDNPVIGRIVGRWMASCPEDVPWWRVVDRNGRFPVGRKDPRLELEQAELLQREGVEVRDGTVDMEIFACTPWA
jgi:methylated-DNA-protein-cysteine methyltransferase-like protein